MLQKTRFLALAALLPALSIAACTLDPPLEPEPVDPPAAPRVVVISIDGLRPDAIAAAGATMLTRLIEEGAASLTARTVVPSITLPSHLSMLTGVIPERHGILWNDDRPTLSSSGAEGPLGMPTVFDRAGEAGYTSAVIAGKPKMRHLLRSQTGVRVSLPRGDTIWRAERVATRALEVLENDPPHVMFIHLPDPDLAGHTTGWMSSEYLAAVQLADQAVARIWQGLRQVYGDDFTLIVTADHGGKGRSHDDGSPESMQIPWIGWGSGVLPQPLPAGIRTVDTAATVLWLLGLATADELDGRAVTSAFHRPAHRVQSRGAPAGLELDFPGAAGGRNPTR